MEVGRRETRRLPRGERCTQCGDRRFYLENGMRFCTNGHEIEGFIQFDLGEEQESGRMGVVNRRSKEARVIERRTLVGLPAKELYLEALQLLLRSQLLWLINEKGFPEELETVARDLWDLRIRGFAGLTPEEHADGKDLEVFSSQPSADETGEKRAEIFGRKSWDPERGSDWPMPRTVDTLCLCYMACLLLRVPVRIGEVLDWVHGENIPFKRVYYDLPQEMRDRMSVAYTRYLKLPLHTPFAKEELHRSVLDLAMGYNFNYELILPALSDISLLTQYARLLALPVDCIQVARGLSRALGCSFDLPIKKSRVFIIDHPEILLVALLVVATKMCFPFDGVPILKDITNNPPALDWQKWVDTLSSQPQTHDDGNFKPGSKDLTAEQIVSLSEDKLDEYFKHLSLFIDKENTNPITRFFPKAVAPPREPPALETADDEIDERLKSTLDVTVENCEIATESQEPDFTTRHNYRAYRSEQSVPRCGKWFYQEAAEKAGLNMESLIRAVYMLEQRIIRWQKQAKRVEKKQSRLDLDADVEF